LMVVVYPLCTTPEIIIYDLDVISPWMSSEHP
jgi:hypothetical protein